MSVENHNNSVKSRPKKSLRWADEANGDSSPVSGYALSIVDKSLSDNQLLLESAYEALERINDILLSNSKLLSDKGHYKLNESKKAFEQDPKNEKNQKPILAIMSNILELQEVKSLYQDAINKLVRCSSLTYYS